MTCQIDWPTLNEAADLSFKIKRRISRKMCTKPECVDSTKPLSTIFRETIESKNAIYALELIRTHKIDLEQEVEGTSWLPLGLAAMKDDVVMIHALLIFNAKLDGKSGYLELTALHASVYGDARNACRELLKLGADPFIRSKNWSTPMNIAVRMNCKEILKILSETKKE